jgi:hypothetical protein
MTKAPDSQSDLYSNYIAVLQSVVNIEMMRKVLTGDTTKPVFMVDDKAMAIKTANRERWDIYTANGTAQIGCTSATANQDEYKPQRKILRKFVRNTVGLNMEDSETRASYYLSMQCGVMNHFAENKNNAVMPTHAQLLKNGARSLFNKLKAT